MNNFRQLVFLSIFVMFFFGFTLTAEAGIISDLRDKILNRTNEIKKLNKEIVEYRVQVEVVQKESRSLESDLKELDTSERRLKNDIYSTNKQITKTTGAISSLTVEIGEKVREINKNEKDLSKTLKILNELELQTLVEIILSQNSFSSFWDTIENIGRFQVSINSNLNDLQKLRSSLESKKNNHEQEKRNLITYEERLNDQKKIVEQNQNRKEYLLTETKNKESNYINILEKRLAKKDALEREIAEFEERLRVEIDPSSLPKTGMGVLKWPLKKITITQYFGKTPFATANPQVYNGSGHNGMDFRASIGTPIFASTNGTVVGVADTDKQCYGVSYGKWILVEHYNGLSTLYAHLSLQKVSVGDEVATGQTIGYSGNTGYSTGPHLHYGVFATKAVRVSNEYTSKICGTKLTLPLSAKNGYLNPLSYLPTI